MERDINVKGIEDKLREKNKNKESGNSIPEDKASSIETKKTNNQTIEKVKDQDNVKEKDQVTENKAIKKDK